MRRKSNISTLEEALCYIEKLETENKQLREEVEVYKNRNFGGRKKHDEAWLSCYHKFESKYREGMSISEIVEQGEISRRTAYRYKAYYDEIQKMFGEEKGDGGGE